MPSNETQFAEYIQYGTGSRHNFAVLVMGTNSWTRVTSKSLTLIRKEPADHCNVR